MEICFVPDNDYGGFLKQAGLVEPHAGDIVDSAGQKVGTHSGIEFYTVGQRRGLGISAAKPLYVVGLDPGTNRVIVGDESQLESIEFEILNVNWVAFEQPPDTFECSARVRYNHPGQQATVIPTGPTTAKVRLHQTARAVTPGQACVLYDGDVVLGGGWIRR